MIMGDINIDLASQTNYVFVVKRQHFTNIDHITHYSKIMALLN